LTFWEQTAQFYTQKTRSTYMKDPETGIWSRRASFRLKFSKMFSTSSQDSQEVSKAPEFSLATDLKQVSITEPSIDFNFTETVELQSENSRFDSPTVFAGKKEDGSQLLFNAPERMPLKLKYSLRCKSCQHLVYKPEGKPQVVVPRIGLFGYLYLPSINALHCEVKDELLTVKFAVRPPKEAPNDIIDGVLLENWEVVDQVDQLVSTSKYVSKINEVTVEQGTFENADGETISEFRVTSRFEVWKPLIPLQLFLKKSSGRRVKFWFILLLNK
jgi:hypothetical protein